MEAIEERKTDSPEAVINGIADAVRILVDDMKANVYDAFIDLVLRYGDVNVLAILERYFDVGKNFKEALVEMVGHIFAAKELKEKKEK